LQAAILGGLTEPFPGPADTKFYRELLQKKVCSNDDGARIILAFAERSDPERNYLERFGRLKELGLLREGWRFSPDDALPADLFAYLLCRSLDIQGGLSARVFGLGPRTAYREAVNLRLMRANGQGRPLSGSEVLSIMARAEEFRKKRESN
jgi:hypothetical protein